MTTDLPIDEIISTTEHFVHGRTTNKDGSVTTWMRSTKPIWVSMTMKERWKSIGFENVPLNKLREFEDLTDEYLYSAVKYVIVATDFQNPAMPEAIINWILGVFGEIMNERNIKGPLEAICPAPSLYLFIDAMLTGKFNKTLAKDAFKEYIETCDLNLLLNNEKYKLADQNVVDSALDAVIAANAEAFEKAKKDPKLVNWLVGQVMKAVAGKAKAPEVRDAILKRLT